MSEAIITVIENDHEPKIMKADDFPPEMQKIPKSVYLFGKKIGERDVPVCKIVIKQFDQGGNLTDDLSKIKHIYVEYFDCDGNILLDQTMIPTPQPEN